MRWIPVLAALFCWVLICLARPPQARPRATRGFKNVALSTARGFGKRTDIQQPRLMVADWLADEIADNPGLARLFVRRFVDTDSDGYLSANELLGSAH